jgi:hypothetical protein
VAELKHKRDVTEAELKRKRDITEAELKRKRDTTEAELKRKGAITEAIMDRKRKLTDVEVEREHPGLHHQSQNTVATPFAGNHREDQSRDRTDQADRRATQ